MQSFIDFKGVDDLRHPATQDYSHHPTHHKDDDGHDEIGNEGHYPCPKILERVG